MILFPNAKINVGLRIVRRRPDGYHDLESVFVPIPWCDVLEIVPAKGSQTTFSIVGDDILQLADPADNLVMKAYRALEKYIGRSLPPLDFYLSKKIPTGAGLGGGSADASFALRGINELLGLGLSLDQLAGVAATVGADCPFFIYNRPMYVQGIGDVMTPIDVAALDDLWVVAAKIPGTEVSTREAYAGVSPAELPAGTDLRASIALRPDKWMWNGLTNDFEESVFKAQPKVGELKHWFDCWCDYTYCAMSGSGSTVFVLLHSQAYTDFTVGKLRQAYPEADIFAGRLSSAPLG